MTQSNPGNLMNAIACVYGKRCMQYSACFSNMNSFDLISHVVLSKQQNRTFLLRDFVV